jgi:UDP-N-acetylmuramyl pentapeptide phosphotransferase/UDP-N-acetylglucosamine-1-phosphate transferase
VPSTSSTSSISILLLLVVLVVVLLLVIRILNKAYSLTRRHAILLLILLLLVLLVWLVPVLNESVNLNVTRSEKGLSKKTKSSLVVLEVFLKLNYRYIRVSQESEGSQGGQIKSVVAVSLYSHVSLAFPSVLYKYLGGKKGTESMDLIFMSHNL